jgi:hypothetical protein
MENVSWYPQVLRISQKYHNAHCRMTVAYLNEIRVQLIKYHFDCHDGRNWNLLKKAIREGALDYKNTSVTNYTNLVVLALQHNMEIVSMNPKQFQEAEDVLNTSSSNSEVQSSNGMSDSKDDGTDRKASSTDDMAVSPPAHESSDSKDDGTALGADFSTEEQSLLADADDSFVAPDVDYCYEGDDDDYHYDHNQPLSKRDYHHTWQELSTRPYVRSPFTINAGKSSSDRRITELESALAELEAYKSFVNLEDTSVSNDSLYPCVWAYDGVILTQPCPGIFPWFFRQVSSQDDLGGVYVCYSCAMYNEVLFPENCDGRHSAWSKPMATKSGGLSRKNHAESFRHQCCESALELKWTREHATYMARMEESLAIMLKRMHGRHTVVHKDWIPFNNRRILERLRDESLPFLLQKQNEFGEIFCSCEDKCRNILNVRGGLCAMSPDRTNETNSDGYCGPPWNEEGLPPVMIIAGCCNNPHLHAPMSGILPNPETWEQYMHIQAASMYARSNERLRLYSTNVDPDFNQLELDFPDLYGEVQAWLENEKDGREGKKRNREPYRQLLIAAGMPTTCQYEYQPGDCCGVTLVWGDSETADQASRDIINPPKFFYTAENSRWVCLKHQKSNMGSKTDAWCHMTCDHVRTLIEICELWLSGNFIATSRWAC